MIPKKCRSVQAAPGSSGEDEMSTDQLPSTVTTKMLVVVDGVQLHGVPPNGPTFFWPAIEKRVCHVKFGGTPMFKPSYRYVGTDGGR